MSKVETPRWRIALQYHCRERMRERVPELKPARAVDEVRAALSAGRVSVERPTWLRKVRPHPHADVSLYAWTAKHERAYVLHTTPTAFIVISVLTEEVEA
jgi:hypothetical protein